MRPAKRIFRAINWRLRARLKPIEDHYELDDRILEIRAALSRQIAVVPNIEVTYTNSLLCAFDTIIERGPGAIRFILSGHAPHFGTQTVGQRGSTYAYWLFSSPETARRMTVTLGDGNEATLARFAPSTNLADVVAIPDVYFFMTDGFIEMRRVAEASEIPWTSRSEELVWRGATSGTGLFMPQLAFEHPHLVAPRMRVCATLRNVPGTDVRFSVSTRPELHQDALSQFGMLGPAVEESSWVSRKYALDIDGHANTWSNLIVRLHLGCCVLKVASAYDYRQWYYDRLKPWEHYVPVKADCSDLVEKLDWVRAHDTEACAIARNGQALARSLTFESVRAEAAELIAANWDR